jgi:hypothetical protein
MRGAQQAADARSAEDDARAEFHKAEREARKPEHRRRVAS